jgi:hypothetical protein
MDQQPNPAANPDAPPPPPANDLPEAHDATTEKIHNLSNFHVSEALGLPLLTKDIGKTSPTGRTTASRADAVAGGERQGYFSYFSGQDRLMFGAAALIILGPLLLGAMRG